MKIDEDFRTVKVRDQRMRSAAPSLEERIGVKAYEAADLASSSSCLF
jgi:hypothetical protein